MTSPGIGIVDNCQPPCGYLKLYLVPTQEQQVILATEHSLHSGQMHIPVVDSGRARKSKIRAKKQGLISGEGLLVTQGAISLLSANGI